MSADNIKVLLNRFNFHQYRKFILNSDSKLILPRPSLIPWISTSKRQDVFIKEYSHNGPYHVRFIKKNNELHAFLWQTNSEKLIKAVRWGIIKTHSITSKVIGTLGQYRILAHERASKGMVSNSQAVKLKLLDLYQDRITALQSIESLINKNNTYADFNKAFLHYIDQLHDIGNNLESYFIEVDRSGLNKQAIGKIKNDIQADKKRAQAYLRSLQNEKNRCSFTCSRGKKSALEFVKQQMIHGLYEFQGINQDMSYSKKRFFALTRGELNDFIEDARKEIDDHQADLRNAVAPEHHGIYSNNAEELITYDFSQDRLSPEREKHVLMAISFIEGWDSLINIKGAKPFISNGSQQEELIIYSATRWRTHKNATALIKSLSYFIVNMIKGLFIPTHSWEEETWENKKFHLNAIQLRTHLKPMKPLWGKAAYFMLQMGYALTDIFKGIHDFSAKMIIKMPKNIKNDWISTLSAPSLDEIVTIATTEIMAIELKERHRLVKLLHTIKNIPIQNQTQPISKLASVKYELTANEQDDLLNAMVRGLSSFASFFTHHVYAKDPMGGMCFSTAYLAGIGMIYMPVLSASIFGSNLVNSFSNVAYAMASSPLGAAIAGGSTLAEGASVAWDGVVHGPSGIAMNQFYQLGEDPLTVGSYFIAAYTLGYVLANGILGHSIPWLSELLKEDLGTEPSIGYPLIGAKVALMLNETLTTHSTIPYEKSIFKELDTPSPISNPTDEKIIKQFKLAFWLSTYAPMLPKLDPKTQFALTQRIEQLFTKEESASLKKLIYPEKHSSIAFQMVAIPLAYIPAVLRFIISFFISLYAWINNNPYPLESIKSAGDSLLEKAKRDLIRVIFFVTHLFYLGYILMTPIIKMLSHIILILVGRIAGLFEVSPGHDGYKLFGLAHNFMRNVGEFFFPVNVIKCTTFAHPTDTLIKVKNSYVNLMLRMKKESGVDEVEEVHHFGPLMGTSSTSSGEQNKVFLRELPKESLINIF